MIILLPILIFFLVGLIISNFLLKNLSVGFLARIALAWCLGTMGIALQLYIYFLIGINWGVLTTIAPWLLILTIIFLRNNKKISVPKYWGIKLNPFNVLVTVYILIISIITFFESTILPINSWDAIASWYLGGKAFFLNQNIDLSYITFSNNSTPPFLNNIIAFSYITIGEINDSIVSAIYPVYLIVGWALIYSFSKKFMGEKLSIIMSILYISTPNLLRHGGRYDVGYADLPLSIYFLASAYMLYLLFKTNSNKILLGVLFLTSTAAMLRSEGIPIFLIITLCIVLLKKMNKQKIVILLLSYGLILSWLLIVHFYQLPTNPFVENFPDINRIPLVLSKFISEFINLTRWNLLWIAFLISTTYYIFYVKKNDFEKVLFFLIFGQLSVYFVIYLMTPIDPASHIENSFDRLLIHLSGFAVIVLVINLSSLLRLPQSGISTITKKQK